MHTHIHLPTVFEHNLKKEELKSVWPEVINKLSSKWKIIINL